MANRPWPSDLFAVVSTGPACTRRSYLAKSPSWILMKIAGYGGWYVIKRSSKNLDAFSFPSPFEFRIAGRKEGVTIRIKVSHRELLRAGEKTTEKGKKERNFGPTQKFYSFKRSTGGKKCPRIERDCITDGFSCDTALGERAPVQVRRAERGFECFKLEHRQK